MQKCLTSLLLICVIVSPRTSPYEEWERLKKLQRRLRFWPQKIRATSPEAACNAMEDSLENKCCIINDLLSTYSCAILMAIDY